MNKKFALQSVVAAVALSMTAGAYAQNTADRPRAADTEYRSNLNQDRSVDINRDALGTDTQTGAISKVNKASNLIGMNVRNAQDERLGEIKDLVVDLRSGRVAYAVLSVGGFLGIGDKYVAIPPNAFSFSADDDKLVLNADKARIENAPGFAKSSWPDLNSPEWRADSSYWMPSDTAQGAAGVTRSGAGSETSQFQTDSDRTLGSTTTDHLNRSDIDTARETFSGRITAIDPEMKTMTVQGESGSRSFNLDERATLTLKDSRNPRLTDLKVGFPVVVGYSEEGGTYKAHSVTRTDAPEVR